MTRDRDQWIEELAADVRPVPRPGRVGHLIVAWWIVSFVAVLGAMLTQAPLRPDVFEQLTSHARFAFETSLGLAAGVVAIAWALRLGLPAPGTRGQRVAPAIGVLLAWMLFYVVGLWAPSLEPSMLGKRAGCYLQVFFFGLPPMTAGLFLLRRLAPLDRVGSAALVGAASGAIPGLLMQLGCMYVPEHILTHHIAPIFALSALGALLGPWVLKRI